QGNGLLLQPGFRMVNATDGYAVSGTYSQGQNSTAAPWAAAIVTYKRMVPTVKSIMKASADPACGSSVVFTVNFSESVTGVNAGDFALAPGAPSGASIASVTGSDGLYTVTVNTGTGSGSIGLNLVDDGSIKDNDGAPIGGTA